MGLLRDIRAAAIAVFWALWAWLMVGFLGFGVFWIIAFNFWDLMRNGHVIVIAVGGYIIALIYGAASRREMQGEEP